MVLKLFIPMGLALTLSSCARTWLTPDRGMEPWVNSAGGAWQRYAVTPEMARAAPTWVWEPGHLEARPLTVAVWNETGRSNNAVNCFSAGDPFKCLLRAAADGRAVRIDVETGWMDEFLGWGVAVAPNRAITIFSYTEDLSLHCSESGCRRFLSYFRCEKPSTIDKHSGVQAHLCDKPYFGLDKK